MVLCMVPLLAAFVISTEALLDTDASDKSVLEDAVLDFDHLVAKYKYPAESHEVVTSDGYILTLHRIPYGRKCGPDQARKPPVLLIHALLTNSISWVLAGPEKAFGYILADDCYDVWLGDTRGSGRGNDESRKHVSLSQKSSAFWDFSWHEVGVYDVPAFIDYILNYTNQPSLHYVGHSQGTTTFFVFNSLYPEQSSRIRSFQALAPIVYLTHFKSPPARIPAHFDKILEGFTKVFGAREFLSSYELLSNVGREICRDRYPALQVLCSNAIFLSAGYDPEQFNTTLLPIITGHFPAGASTKEFVHYAQVFNSGFRQYDHGWIVNRLKYGSIHPPFYNLSNIRVPVALHYSLNDWYVDVRDLDRLASELPNLIGKFLVPYPKFNHLDYIWAIDAKPLLYDRVMEIMDNY